jgi:ABC-2 type transport system ATP-binding protein
MRQRLCLAHTLVHDPQLLILDEPASGLGPRARGEMREIRRVLRSMGKNNQVSSGILPELGEMCTGVGIIDRGQLLRSGSIDEIERSLRAGAVLRIELLSDAEPAAEWLRRDPRVGEIEQQPGDAGTTELEVPFDGTLDDQARLLGELIAAGHRVSAFSQATSDLEEIFLKVTGQEEEAA